jgi:hypothetical protein
MRSGPLDRLGVDVVEQDRVARLDRELGDARAHRPRPDHTDDAGHRDQTGLIASNGCRQARQKRIVRHCVGPNRFSRTVVASRNADTGRAARAR